MYLDRSFAEKSSSFTKESLGDSSFASFGKNPIIENINKISNKKLQPEKNASKKSLLDLSETNKKIIVIDDNQIIRNSIKRMLESALTNKPETEKIDICSGTDGIDLIKFIFPDNNIIDTQKVLCVFIDENMEYLNGSDAVKILRHLETKNKLHHINVVSVSCHEDSKFVDFILSSGVDFFLSKPVSKNDITNVLKKLKII